MGRLRQALSNFFLRGNERVDNVGSVQGLEDLVNAAADLLDTGQAEQAKALLDRALALDSRCVAVWSNLAYAELQLRNAQAAEESARHALSLDPSHGTAWHNLGESYVLRRKAKEALECNDRALTLDPGRAPFWLGRGEALMLLERFPEAVACFERALTLQPGMASAACNREMALLQADPARRTLLLQATGVAALFADGKLADVDAAVASLARDCPACDKDFVRGFSTYAEMNLGQVLALPLCRVSLAFAAQLRDPELLRVCEARWREATAARGPR